ncbi:MAG TPA: hypothetical protein DD490_02160, partial [Acidobacteria bacterium]|nr:hypothetical protein [Acidobacteriota bacterium]
MRAGPGHRIGRIARVLPVYESHAPSALPPDRIARLRALLPAEGTPLLVGGAPDLAAAPGVRSCPPEHLGEVEPESLGGILLLDDAELPPLPALLASLRRVLGGAGRLAIELRRTSLRELTVALSEAGFVVLKTEPAVQARKEPFFVRPYREGDEAQILPLFRQSFFVERSPERFRWEYRENPAGNERISEAFAEDGRLVAHYAGYPVRFWSDVSGAPRTLPALQVGDTMTEPSVRH